MGHDPSTRRHVTENLTSAIFGIDACVASANPGRNLLAIDRNGKPASKDTAILHMMNAEDIVFIKTCTPQAGLAVSAVGVVLAKCPPPGDKLVRIPVKWLWKKNIENPEENDVHRGDPLHEEFDPKVQRDILDLVGPISLESLVEIRQAHIDAQG